MKLQTIVDIAPSAWKIGYEDKILMLGSCFSDEIGEQMKQRRQGYIINVSSMVAKMPTPVMVLVCVLIVFIVYQFITADLQSFIYFQF